MAGGTYAGKARTNDHYIDICHSLHTPKFLKK
jgi:hypothetical protein